MTPRSPSLFNVHIACNACRSRCVGRSITSYFYIISTQACMHELPQPVHVYCQLRTSRTLDSCDFIHAMMIEDLWSLLTTPLGAGVDNLTSNKLVYSIVPCAIRWTMNMNQIYTRIITEASQVRCFFCNTWRVKWASDLRLTVRSVPCPSPRRWISPAAWRSKRTEQCSSPTRQTIYTLTSLTGKPYSILAQTGLVSRPRSP